MEQRGGGWWTGTTLAVGSRYAFSIDGGPARPDPRSLYQPEGIHGPSEIVDPLRIAPRGWRGRDARGTVMYELHIGTFTQQGTFDAAITRLSYLAELGVEAVEIMPVASFAGDRGWGYDGVGLYGVHACYGGPEGLARFVAAAHDHGLAVILDVVYNHLGPEGNYLAEFGPYFNSDHRTPWGDAINLDGEQASPVREFIIGAARQWLVDFGLDGLRLDAVHALVDTSPTHLLAELASRTKDWEREVQRPLTLIAESDLNQPAMVSPVGTSPEACGMDAQWADDVHHALHAFLTREEQGYYGDFGTAEVLAKAMQRVFVHDGTYSSFRGKDWGSPVDPSSSSYDGHSFVVFLQNHDQVGNRACGDRISHTISPALQAAGAALYLLSAYTPQIFMGEEWDTTSPFPFFSDLGPELGPLVSKGRAEEFAAMDWDGEVPDPQASSTRDQAVLNWSEQTLGNHARMLGWYRDLIRLRQEPDIANPSLNSTTIDIVDSDTIVMWRGEIGVVVSRSEAGASAPVGRVEVLAAWDPPTATGDTLTLSGPGAVVVKR